MRLAVALLVALSSVASAKPTPVVVGATLPDFGCLGWSPKLGLAACVVGSRGSNIGMTMLRIEFVPVRDTAVALAPIVLRQENDQRGPDELSTAEHDLLAKHLEGFVTLDRSGPVLHAKLPGKTTPVTIGGATLSAKVTAVAKEVAAPRYQVVMTYARDKVKRALDDQTDSIGGYEARVFVIEGMLLVERTYSTGDEGIYGHYGAVWRCTKTACDEPLE